MAESYLITGVAGTGKSTLKQAFDKKGYATIDIDRGYATWQDKTTRQIVEPPTNEPPEWYAIHDWFVDRPKLTARIDEQKLAHEPLLVFGNTADLYTMHGLFRKMFALEYHDESLIKERIYRRTNSDYGKDPTEFAELLSYYRPMQEKFRSVGATTIDCSLQIEHIVEIIENDIRA